jgi:phosphoribosylanthranilate isomerase
MSLWIKICGNTSLPDAALAAEAGADAVGFVFAPSPRQVTVAQVAAIVPALPEKLEKVGVFVNAAFAEIESAVRACGLTGVQLHFDAAPELSARLRKRFGAALRILRVMHFAACSLDWEPKRARYDADPNIDGLLVDSRTATATGGTGLAFDWQLAAKTVFQNAKARKCIAAGGLTPANVAEAIAVLQPWGVDAVSGVEAAPGRKDPVKVRAFVANARAASRG